MSAELIISGKPIKIIEWNGQRVITTKEIADVHNMDVKIINEKFRRNKEYLKLNVDYFEVSRQVAENNLSLKDLFYRSHYDYLLLITERGYLKITKTIKDKMSWEVQDKLIDSYFRDKETQSNLNNLSTKFLEKSKENRKELTHEWKEHDAKDYRYLTISEYDALFKNSSIRKKNMDDSQLTLLSAFEFLESRKLQNNPQIKGDSELSESMLSTGNQINNIINPKMVKQ